MLADPVPPASGRDQYMECSMIRNLIAIVLIGSSLALAGCNTVRGIGQDVESIGETVEDAAD